MNDKKNEQGYAMIIVLMLIVFITIASAAFMRASISNAKQERIVDTNNMAVVAAEMGIKYYVNDIKNEEMKIYKYVQSEMEGKVICVEQNVPEGCESFESIQQYAKNEYKKKFDELIKTYLGKIGDLRDDIHPLDIRITYKLFDFKKISEEDDEDIIIELGVEGNSSSNDEELTATINYKVPEVKDGGNGAGFPSVTDPDIIFDLFIPENVKKENPCIGNGGCKGNGGTYFTTGDLSYNNLNKTGNFTWIHKGKLDSKNNMQNINMTFIVESIIGKNNMGNIEGRVVLLGKKNGSGELRMSDIKTKGNGKVCVNLDGFNSTDISEINFEGNIMYYSSNNEAYWPGMGNTATRFNGSLVDFVRNCTGLQPSGPPIDEDIPGDNPPTQIIYDRFKVDVNMDVIYNP